MPNSPLKFGLALRLLGLWGSRGVRFLSSAIGIRYSRGSIGRPESHQMFVEIKLNHRHAETGANYIVLQNATVTPLSDHPAVSRRGTLLSPADDLRYLLLSEPSDMTQMANKNLPFRLARARAQCLLRLQLIVRRYCKAPSLCFPCYLSSQFQLATTPLPIPGRRL